MPCVAAKPPLPRSSRASPVAAAAQRGVGPWRRPQGTQPHPQRLALPSTALAPITPPPGPPPPSPSRQTGRHEARGRAAPVAVGQRRQHAGALCRVHAKVPVAQRHRLAQQVLRRAEVLVLDLQPPQLHLRPGRRAHVALALVRRLRGRRAGVEEGHAPRATGQGRERRSAGAASGPGALSRARRLGRTPAERRPKAMERPPPLPCPALHARTCSSSSWPPALSASIAASRSRTSTMSSSYAVPSRLRASSVRPSSSSDSARLPRASAAKVCALPNFCAGLGAGPGAQVGRGPAARGQGRSRPEPASATSTSTTRHARPASTSLCLCLCLCLGPARPPAPPWPCPAPCCADPWPPRSAPAS
jgi:hypothetical protein